LLDTIDEIREAIADPDAFIERLKATRAMTGNPSAVAAIQTASDAVDGARAVHEAATTAATIATTAHEVAHGATQVASHSAAVMRQLRLTRREVIGTFLFGGGTLALAVLFTLFGRWGGTATRHLTPTCHESQHERCAAAAHCLHRARAVDWSCVRSYLWDSGGGANLTQLAMPFSVLLTKL
jgi:hypothetical protein